MAVSVDQLRTALKAGTSTQETESLTRLLALSNCLVLEAAPSAPAVIQDQAVVQLAGYLFDQPTSPGGRMWSNALANAGALHLLSRWRVRGASVIRPATTVAVPPNSEELDDRLSDVERVLRDHTLLWGGGLK